MDGERSIPFVDSPIESAGPRGLLISKKPNERLCPMRRISWAIRGRTLCRVRGSCAMPPRTGQSRISYSLVIPDSLLTPDSRIYTNRLYRYSCCDTVSATRSCALWTRARPASEFSLSPLSSKSCRRLTRRPSVTCAVSPVRAQGAPSPLVRGVCLCGGRGGAAGGAGGEVKEIRLGVTTAPFGPTSPEECGRSLLWSSYCSPFPWYWPVRTKIPSACA